MSKLIRLKRTIARDSGDKEKKAIHDIIVGILKEELEHLRDNIRNNLLVYGKMEDGSEKVGMYHADRIEYEFMKAHERIDQ